MKLLLHTETTIDSCHFLEMYKGKCSNLHGHTWKIEIWIQGESEEKDEVGILVDFGVVKKLSDELDHKNLNVVLGYNSTAENLAEWVYKYIKDTVSNERILLKVRVYETAVTKQTWCETGDF